MKNFLKSLRSIALALSVAGPAAAAYPEKPANMIIAFTASGNIYFYLSVKILGVLYRQLCYLYISFFYFADKKNGIAKNAQHALFFSASFVFAIWRLLHFILLVPTPVGLFI